ncbi:50S ribosomal protein L10 [bacterium]|uniref:Large ribosomal subunit protein uL10 n=2 Tax=Katanobacteria TaxID=422282 RepID=A0A2M7X408_UNCKA|nr:50S ribosomal protein L10 [bacterium]PIP56990.1 MAG: 50S ribosomal protein L10 [candidate division WWE3 bacterium CG22_combo_CG10-13_8_21_14_all_39_12]PJA40878.1 MAG: 50S ribosomal protein L10 [candidate division WWE3 bacterium CG_4_9_14_3_um_filter_39_7]
MPNIKNIEQVEKLAQTLSKANGSVFVDYRGLSHTKLEELRLLVEQAGGQLQITKNTLLKIALEKNGSNMDEVISKDLTGPTATIFLGEDLITPLKNLSEFIKTNELPVIKSGFVEQNYTSAEQINKLAKLPSKEILLSMLMGTINAPTTSLARVIKAPVQYLVYALNGISSQKQQGGEA